MEDNSVTRSATHFVPYLDTACPSEAKKPHRPVNARHTLLSAAILGFLGVSLGAFGAHALEERLTQTGYLDVWQTAVLYHFVHTLALFGIGLWRLQHPANSRLGAAALCMLAGVVVFSGSLYTLSLTGIGVLGAITPIGGLGFLAGWVFLGLAALKTA